MSICPHAVTIKSFEVVKGCNLAEQKLLANGSTWRKHYHSCTAYTMDYKQCPRYRKPED